MPRPSTGYAIIVDGLFKTEFDEDKAASWLSEELSDEELLIKLHEEANALLLEHEAKLVDVTPEDG